MLNGWPGESTEPHFQTNVARIEGILSIYANYTSINSSVMMSRHSLERTLHGRRFSQDTFARHGEAEGRHGTAPGEGCGGRPRLHLRAGQARHPDHRFKQAERPQLHSQQRLAGAAGDL